MSGFLSKAMLLLFLIDFVYPGTMPFYAVYPCDVGTFPAPFVYSVAYEFEDAYVAGVIFGLLF